MRTKNFLTLITIAASGLLLLTACSSSKTTTSEPSSSSPSSSSMPKNSSGSSSASSMASASAETKSFASLTAAEKNQVFAAWAADLTGSNSTNYQVMTGSAGSIYLLNTGSSGSNGSTDIAELIKATSRVQINADGSYSLQSLDSQSANGMAQDPFVSGSWQTIAANQSGQALLTKYADSWQQVKIDTTNAQLKDPSYLAN